MNMENNKKKHFEWFTRKTKGQKVSFIVSTLFFIISIVLLFVFMDARGILGDEVADTIYGQGVANGWVGLGKAIANSGSSWLLTLLVICVSFVVHFIVNFLSRLLAGNGRKGKTIGALIRSLTKYVIIIVDIAIIFTLWGVNVASVLAGVGIVTLIVGLGCQTLIQDVIAGLFIVFDDYFAVGDTCIIDGFRGTIVDIGLKSTKLKDAGGNIKSINNSSITTVVDLSREDSLVTVEFTASYNEDPIRVEGILLKELPEMKKRLPQITSDISYKGISSMNDSDISYLVACKCQEKDRFQVKRDLNRELLLMLRNNDIQYVYPQIVVNPADPVDRPKPTKEEEEITDRTLKDMRKKEEEEKESFSLFRRAKKSFDETAKGFENEVKK